MSQRSVSFVLAPAVCAPAGLSCIAMRSPRYN